MAVILGFTPSEAQSSLRSAAHVRNAGLEAYGDAMACETGGAKGLMGRSEGAGAFGTSFDLFQAENSSGEFCRRAVE